MGFKLVASNTDLPVPRVLAWSDSTSGPVGAEFIIMEHVAGVPILQKWHKMRGEQHIQFIRSIGTYMQKLGSLSFPAYGESIFLRHSTGYSDKVSSER